MRWLTSSAPSTRRQCNQEGRATVNTNHVGHRNLKAATIAFALFASAPWIPSFSQAGAVTVGSGGAWNAHLPGDNSTFCNDEPCMEFQYYSPNVGYPKIQSYMDYGSTSYLQYSAWWNCSPSGSAGSEYPADSSGWRCPTL